MNRGGRRNRSPSVATLLSTLWPGLGQLYLGHRQAALVYATPIVVALGVVVVQALGGIERLGLALLSPSVALTVAVLIGLLGLWRLLSMADAFVSAGGGESCAPSGARWGSRRPGARRRRRPRGRRLVRLVLLRGGEPDLRRRAGRGEPAPAVVGPRRLGVRRRAERLPGGDADRDAAHRRARGSTSSSSARTGRRTGDHSLTDTLLVVSIDPATKSAAMVSLPRDLARFPLSDGRIYQGKINSLLSYADRHRSEFPDGGMTTLVREVGYLVGVPIHYYAAINLPGFQAMIDAVGGVRVYNEKPIDDPFYVDWRDPSRRGFSLSVGWHTLDGDTALAFVRSRRGSATTTSNELAASSSCSSPSGPSSPTRRCSRRSRAFSTRRRRRSGRTSRPNGCRTCSILGRQIAGRSIARKVLGPPYATRATDTSIYMLIPDMAAFARVPPSSSSDRTVGTPGRPRPRRAGAVALGASPWPNRTAVRAGRPLGASPWPNRTAARARRPLGASPRPNRTCISEGRTPVLFAVGDAGCSRRGPGREMFAVGDAACSRRGPGRGPRPVKWWKWAPVEPVRSDGGTLLEQLADRRVADPAEEPVE
ncbi:MAG: hypothetical protein KatS3mg065_0271 [Chloroflexota bacterium]|nr:MAG: hypothetical protein KatS3mg065_0271 [Chloroflexota bacterium]